MNIKQVNPYIQLNGTAAKAMKLYETVLGAKIESVSHYGDTPGMNVPPEAKDLVMHSALRIGESVIMLSDEMPGHAAFTGTNVQIALHLSDSPDVGKAFEALAAGGKIRSPLQETFWGARFGMLTDQYGVEWMFNCEIKK